MFNALRHWHWNLLHRVFGLPDRNHTEPGASLSAILHSHPAVPAHRHHLAQRNAADIQTQLERERQRQPRVLKGWQQTIDAAFERRLTKRRPH